MGGEFTQEELEILGEDTPDTEPETPSEDEDDTGESQESEEKPEETPASEEKEEPEAEPKEEGEGEKEKGPVPYDRFSKVYGEKKELERKLELFRKDPEEYFKQYPDEKPKGEQQKEQEKTDIPTFGEAGNLVVQGGEYDGLTLRQVYEKDPFTAQDIYMQYRESLLAHQREEQETSTRLKEESDKEVNSFASERAKDLFDKDLDKLSEKEVTQINQEINETLDWMAKTGRGAGNLKDGYILKNLDKLLENATKKGASGLVNQLKKPSSSSISSKRTSSDTSMNNYLNMDINQLAAVIDNMGDQEFLNFKKNAPPALREKLPGLDWD